MLNPCGFAMLPAYLSYFIGTGDASTQSRAATLGRALLVGAVVSAGFLLVFGITGILITAEFQAIADVVPWIALAIGAAIIVIGIAMLCGFELTPTIPKAERAGKGRGTRNLFAFGVSCAIASLCARCRCFSRGWPCRPGAPISSPAFLTFVVYGLGMSMLSVGVTLALGIGQQSLVRRLRRSVRYVNRIAGEPPSPDIPTGFRAET